MISEYFISFLIAYLLGSIPFAYIFSKILYNIDIQKSGTGNTGTLNFLRVTGSKSVALLVMILDMGKGAAAIIIGGNHYPDLLWLMAPAVIIGHVFPFWLKFQGGRGLAPFGGIFLILNFWIIIIWLVLFTLVYFPTRKYILATVNAIILINLIIAASGDLNLFFISMSCSVIVILKYLPRLKQEMVQKSKKQEK